MKRLTKDQRRNIRKIFEDKSCTYCKYIFPLVDWWCGNEDAIKMRGSSIPDVIHCPYFKIDKNYTRKELKIKKPNNKNIDKIIKTIICIVVLAVLMIITYNVWGEYDPYTWLSFFSSLIIHGTFVGMIYLGINKVLNKILKYKK